MDYQGDEKRKDNMFNKDFYDKMMEMHSNVKHIVEWSEDHDEQDDARFIEANKKIDLNMKFMYMAMGGLLAVQIIVRMIK